jgi:outer membrane lipoprotein-sorting protein
MKHLALSLCAALALACAAVSPAAQITVNPEALGNAPDKPKPRKPKPAKPAPVKPKASAAKPPKIVKPAAIPAAAPILAVPAIAGPSSGPERDKLDLQRISGAMNAIRTLKGQFIQVGPNGEMDQGLVYVNKPGRMRFEYAKPSPYLIVADGVSVAVGNSNVKTVDRYPLIDNPLSLILDDEIDLGATGTVSRIERKPGQLVVTAERKDGSMKGSVTLIFAEPSLELKQWVVTDAQGLQTMITLQDMQTGVTLNPELFILRDVNKFADPRE